MNKTMAASWPLICLGALMTSAATAATVRFDIAPAGGEPGDAVSAGPGDEVCYELTAIVTSDDPAASDNDGLAFFAVNVETDLGVTQSPVDELEPVIADNFPIVQSLGTPAADDVLSIGGAQNTFTGDVQTGIALGQTQVLARGRLVMPGAPGTFTVAGPTGTANVFRVGSTTAVDRADIETGPGFTITVTTDPLAGACPDDVAVQCESCDELAVTYEVIVAGSCDAGAASCTPASGSAFPVGTTTVTCTANGSSCTFNVTVERTGPPSTGGGCGAGTGAAFFAAVLMLAAVRLRGRSEPLAKGR